MFYTGPKATMGAKVTSMTKLWASHYDRFSHTLFRLADWT
jgi:hypothetical protein